MKGMGLPQSVEQPSFFVAWHAFAGIGLAAEVGVALQHVAAVLAWNSVIMNGPVPTGQWFSYRLRSAMPGCA